MRDNTDNRALPLVAIVDGGGSVDTAFSKVGAETMDVDSKADAKLALTYADAIVFTGGGDVDPARYGAKRHTQVYGVDQRRDKLEFWLARKAMERGIPMLGICRGSQVLNVAHGGTLNQHIYDSDTVTDHWGTDLWVRISQKSRIARTLLTKVMQSSHFHHQAVGRVGTGLRPIAWAGDGTIEAIESAPGNRHYVLGVQFHPEMDYYRDNDALAIFQHFTWEEAARFAAGRKQSAVDRMKEVDLLRPARTRWGPYGYGHYASSAGSEDQWGQGWRTPLDRELELEDAFIREGLDTTEYPSLDAFIEAQDGDEARFIEWLRDNASVGRAMRADEDAKEEADAACISPPCEDVSGCLHYADCMKEVVANRTSNTDAQVVKYTSAEDLEIAANKRGNPGRSGA